MSGLAALDIYITIVISKRYFFYCNTFLFGDIFLGIPTLLGMFPGMVLEIVAGYFYDLDQLCYKVASIVVY